MQLTDWIFITAIAFATLFTVVVVAELKYGAKVKDVIATEDEEEYDPFVQTFTENPNVRKKREEVKIYDETDLEEPEHESSKW